LVGRCCVNRERVDCASGIERQGIGRTRRYADTRESGFSGLSVCRKRQDRRSLNPSPDRRPIRAGRYAHSRTWPWAVRREATSATAHNKRTVSPHAKKGPHIGCGLWYPAENLPS
jgi:hypothetical protein